MRDEVDLLAALSVEQLANLVDKMATDPDDKHMPASVRTAYRCKKNPTGDFNRDSLINYINEIALNTPEDRGRTSTAPIVHRPQHPPSKYQDQAGERVHPVDSSNLQTNRFTPQPHHV